MKILFIIFLLTNLIYLGYEMDKEAHIQRKTIPPLSFDKSKELKLLSETHIESLTPRAGLIDKMSDTTLPLTSERTEGVAPISELMTLDAAIEVEDSDSQLIEMLQNDMSQRKGEGKESNEEQVCLSFGPFDQMELAQELMAWFKNHHYMTQQRWEYENAKQLFWVYLAPMEQRSEALATLKQLQTLGVEDFRLIRKGSFKNAISLGLFSSQARVNRRLKELNSQGYQPIVVPYGNGNNEAKKILWLDIMLPNQKQFLESLYQTVPARFNSLPLDCDKIDMVATNP